MVLWNCGLGLLGHLRVEDEKELRQEEATRLRKFNRVFESGTTQPYRLYILKKYSPSQKLSVTTIPTHGAFSH